MIDLDLKLLSIFEEIYRTKNVSQAAESLGISQPTVSMGLRKLRERFNDPLFVRTSNGMEPTPCADDLWPQLSEANRLLTDALTRKVRFSPDQCSRRFRVCMTDVGLVALLPALLGHLNRVAPTIGLEVIRVGNETAKLLESNEADLAIGFVPSLEAGFYEQTLFTEGFVFLARSGHPRIGDTMTLKACQEEAFLEVSTPGTGHWMLERAFAAHRLQPRVGIRLPMFLGIGGVIANSDLVCTVPSQLAGEIAKTADVKVLQPPFAIPGYAVKQHWHERMHRDERSRWLRQTVAEVFLGKTAAGS